jgi:hypothetical protein
LFKRLLVPACLLVVSALALAACGGSKSDESQIKEAVETSAASTDPADCKKLSTQQFMEQTTKSSGSEAAESCEEQASNDEGVETATVSSVEVDGSKATADTVLAGGTFDRQEVEVALVKDGDQWKLDEIAGFTKFDPTKVIETFEEEFAKPSSEVSKSQAACVAESFEEAAEAEFEEALLSPTTDGFEEIAGSCF